MFSVDGKSQTQALERPQPILSIRPGVPERQTHYFYCHVTTTLYVALNVVTGAVIGVCTDTHKGEDSIAFLKLLDRKTPKGKVLHIIADNYSADKTKQVTEYLESKKGRFLIHFIPPHFS